MRSDVSLTGPEGVILAGTSEACRFGGWSLRPVGPGLSELAVTDERPHAYYSTRPITSLRLRFRPDRARPSVVIWWHWATATRVGPGRYRVQGLPKVVEDDQQLRERRHDTRSA
jgi:hypothetical protein